MKLSSPAAIPNQIHKSDGAHARPSRANSSSPPTAYGLYEQRGTEGNELDDWLQAESGVTEQKMKTVGA